MDGLGTMSSTTPVTGSAVAGVESMMSRKAHGTCSQAAQTNLKYGMYTPNKQSLIVYL